MLELIPITFTVSLEPLKYSSFAFLTSHAYEGGIHEYDRKYAVLGCTYSHMTSESQSHGKGLYRN